MYEHYKIKYTHNFFAALWGGCECMRMVLEMGMICGTCRNQGWAQSNDAQRGVCFTAGGSFLEVVCGDCNVIVLTGGSAIGSCISQHPDTAFPAGKVSNRATMCHVGH